MAGFVPLTDSGRLRHRPVSWDHVSVVEVSRADGAVTLWLLDGGKLSLTPDESRQLIDFIRTHRAEIEIG